MDYKLISIDKYKVLINNNRGYMALSDLEKLFNDNRSNIKTNLDNIIDSNSNKDNCITYLNESYYSLDIIVLASFDYDYKYAFKIYEIALKNGIVFTDFITKTINEEKASFKKLNSIVDLNKNMINAFYKYDTVEDNTNIYGNPGHITLESLKILIGIIKDKYNLSDNFGVIKDYSSLMDILYFTNSASYQEKSDEIDFGKDDDISYIVKTMYNIIKKKPFVNGNEIISSFIAYYYLNQANMIEYEGERITTSEDICLATGLILNSKDDNIVDTLKKVKSLLTKHYDSITTNILWPIIDTSKEKIMDYIISSIEHFSGYQGYYDYFKGKNYVYKIHYHGKYNNFSLNKDKSSLSDNTLFFKGTLHCFSEAPSDLENRNEFLKNIVEEIKIRSYNDVIIPFLDELKNKVKPYFDLDSISIDFDFDIKTKFDEDYDL